MNEEQLINELRQHKEEALNQTIRQYSSLVSTIIRNIARGILTPADVEETAADVFFTLWQNVGNIKGPYLKGYLCRIAKTKTQDSLRRLKILDMANIDELSEADEYSLSEHIDNAQLHDDIQAALQQFSKQDREILIRYYYYYQTAQRISEITGLKLETVKSRIKRAKPKLRSFLQERGY